MTAVRAMLLGAGLVTGLMTMAARAHEGHDDDASPAPAIPGAGVPRVEAQSDLFELVGVVQDGVMTIFVDRYATNEPVVDAKIDIDAGPVKGSAQANPEGTYTFKHAALTQPGQFPVTFTIAAGGDSDLLAGELVIADPAAAGAHAGDDLWRSRWWWVGGVLVLLVGIVVAWRLRRRWVGGGAQ